MTNEEEDEVRTMIVEGIMLTIAEGVMIVEGMIMTTIGEGTMIAKGRIMIVIVGILATITTTVDAVMMIEGGEEV